MDSFLGKLEMFAGSISLIIPHFPARKMTENLKKHIGVNDRIIGILEDNKSSLNLFKSRSVPFRNYLLYFQLLGITFLDLLITEPEKLNEKGRELAELKKKKEYEWEQMMKAYREQNIMGPGMLYPFVKTKMTNNKRKRKTLIYATS